MVPALKRYLVLEQVTKNETSKLCGEKQKTRENSWDVKRVAEEVESQTKMWAETNLEGTYCSQFSIPKVLNIAAKSCTWK